MTEQTAPCPQCHKPTRLCVCKDIIPQKTKHHVLILQHPQEPDQEIGTALLTHLALPNSTLKVGLSWRNLSAALGKKEVQPQKWMVLYLGSGLKDKEEQGPSAKPPLQFLSKKGNPTEPPPNLEGLVILDGSWSQAKALWWRNPWLLKLRRALLTPKHPSLYKELRREPRKECLSTIESVAESLDALGENPQAGTHLRQLFKHLLENQRKALGKH